MASDRFAPGKHKILDALREADQTPNARGLTFGDLLERTGLDRSILSQYLKDLQDGDLVERTTDRRYLILDQGKEALDRRDDVLVISRSGKVLRKEIQPSQDVLAPRIFPIDASIYINPETEQLIEEAAEELGGTVNPDGTKPPVSKEEAIRTVLAEITDPIATHFDTMFLRRFYKLAEDWRVYRVQQMQPAERRDYLREFHHWIMPAERDANARRQMESTLDQLERQYVHQKFPEGGPSPLAFETILDFEAAVVVSVSRDRLKNEATTIRNRLALLLLSFAIHGGDLLPRLPPGSLSAMAETGIITPEEFEQYRMAKGSKQRLRILQTMWLKYYRLAWGVDPLPRPKIIHVPLKPERHRAKRGDKPHRS
jgi:DNA-binding MarR family transcriptional regulator